MDTCEITEKRSCNDVEKSSEPKQAIPRRTYVPAVDVLESAGETVIYADMPGVDETSIDIVLENNVLTIRGIPESVDFPGKVLVYRELGVGDFERSFTLTDAVDREAISASIRHGVLKVVLPKANPGTRKIAVTAS